jgi:hypothetical protein
MNRIYPSDLAAFVKTYRFAGGRVRRIKVGFAGENLTVEVVLTARTAVRDLGQDARAARLRLRVVGVEEFRFQKRPSTAGGKVTDARIGYFGDLYFVNLDAWGLQPGEVPKMHDYRASDMYIGGRELWWEEIEPKKE